MNNIASSVESNKPCASSMLAVGVVYLTAFLQGLILVSFPASSVILKSVYGLSDAQYGAIFLPQVLLAVVGAIGGGALASRLGLKTLLWLALAINGLSQLALAGIVSLPTDSVFLVISIGTAAMGFAFGVGGAPLNSYPPVFFPRHSDTALIALHTVLGVGLASGPLFASWFIVVNLWVAFPLMLLAFSVILMFLCLATKLPVCQVMKYDVDIHNAKMEQPYKAAVFWIFLLIAVIYAFAEGTFSNWAVIYLQDVKQLPMGIAGLALSIFWVAMVSGRLLISLLVLRIPAERIWPVLPVIMIVAFLLLPHATTPVLGIALFALAGLSCSGFFPLGISLISKRFKHHVAWVSSMMIAALMVGIGMGSFIIGPLRSWFSFEQLYQLSTLYPISVLLLILLVGIKHRQNIVHADSQSAPS